MSGTAETKALEQWSRRALENIARESPGALQPVAGDASSRRYFRLATGAGQYIAVHAPPEMEKNAEFVAVQDMLSRAGVRVPAIVAKDFESGFLLLEDLGDELLLPALDAASVDGYYDKAFAVLVGFAQMDAAALPAYDRALLGEELSRFPQWFVQEMLGIELGADERQLLSQFDACLTDSALEQPQVFVHRDFHSRNLMLLADGELAVIDFQDAVRGPVTYDLVSLLRDCYIRWSAEQVATWARNYRQQLLAQTSLALPGEAQFLRWFDLMGLQRHIKVLGTFARLYLRDGKSAYLQDLPLVVRYTCDMLEAYAQEEVFARVLDWFNARLMPEIQRQTWGSDL